MRYTRVLLAVNKNKVLSGCLVAPAKGMARTRGIRKRLGNLEKRPAAAKTKLAKSRVWEKLYMVINENKLVRYELAVPKPTANGSRNL